MLVNACSWIIKAINRRKENGWLAPWQPHWPKTILYNRSKKLCSSRIQDCDHTLGEVTSAQWGIWPRWSECQAFEFRQNAPESVFANGRNFTNSQCIRLRAILCALPMDTILYIHVDYDWKLSKHQKCLSIVDSSCRTGKCGAFDRVMCPKVGIWPAKFFGKSQIPGEVGGGGGGVAWEWGWLFLDWLLH